MVSRDEREDWMLACGCSKVKGVMELLMKEMGILGEVVENDIAFTQMARSISQAEWQKLEFIMARMIGFSGTWLLDPATRKAGLLEAAEKL